VLEPPIPRSVRFAEAPAAGRSVLTTAHRAKGTDAYRELAGSLFS
jgi:chromosome partitioning protein